MDKVFGEASFLEYLQPGCVFRRSDLIGRLNGIDRVLGRLLAAQLVVRVGRGMYHYPKLSRFGVLPADPEELVRVFLGNADFLLVSPNDFNGLSVGTTQLYNHVLVYNRKRRGRVILDGREFEFLVRSDLPDRVTPLFLLEALLGYLDNLAEDRVAVRSRAQERLRELKKDSGG
ncbi:hypothetical protein GMLC_21640 [Geomonas limicola]|uniref:Uncharacterized protein n=1 Tax=Geomonas limicola TaxID=2740186 RepID=A0A6V8N7P7_9BACT|nr:hypothetical protein [Geomonas limicola]GFO68585.1 hypothetical protein GMLC_21640 [Geomonas limicola]